MPKLFQNIVLVFCSFMLHVNFIIAQSHSSKKIIEQAKEVIARTINERTANSIHFSIENTENKIGEFSYHVKNGQLYIEGNSSVALCRGFYDYLKSSQQGMITWSGSNLNLSGKWNAVADKKVASPYEYHYYMNVVTHGYSTPYWGWNRWQKELDWMALHGINMLVINDAYEAIMIRVFKKLGISNEAIQDFFPGPAFQPWNRMGNITGWDGPPPASWYKKQIALTRQVLDRMRQMQMTPIIQAFAGFVPNEITKVYPNAKITPLIWNSNFPMKDRCSILLPNKSNATLFIRIGKMFVQEWEKEFGKETFFLADSFNEMHVPREKDETEEQFQQQLAEYGDVVYQSIKQGDKEAVWTMQGWTFGYQHADWSPIRLNALVSKTPDNKVLFLDLANDYNLDWWHIVPSWKYFKGFSNKMWIYSFIPNMGGKTPWNGILKTYAEAPITALQYKNKGHLVGFGFAPEGIENNELVYELLSDMGWRDTKIDLDKWLKNYCINRYGAYPEKMQMAYRNFLKSCYGTFTDHPRFAYQSNATVNKSPQFFAGVQQFLDCANDCKNSILYKNDAIELSAQYLSLVADSLVKSALQLNGVEKENQLKRAYAVLANTDRLLLSHPNDRLDRWVNFAKAFGDNKTEKQYYAQDARRIITSWGPGVGDYAAKMWGGLVNSYYLPRLKNNFDAQANHSKFDLQKWEENWVQNGDEKPQQPFANPLMEAQNLVKENVWKN
ncbi:alpha-N-acetylglucosaminidase [Arachidicoccus soli]|uniref:Alpha-N-acetylglucosaminidase n=1 Tax=Arachidicoccus soli TaxID=2341117 RepID=A0A386HT73_9BACT|nr:alpha-N-acetylglucosaminidase [Arachidicoccus soli]AYD48716.1 alpha-N-acetylglucosaminidase [Arachidicoccus soli]